MKKQHVNIVVGLVILGVMTVVGIVLGTLIAKGLWSLICWSWNLV